MEHADPYSCPILGDSRPVVKLQMRDVSVPKPGRGSLYDERKVTREMKDDAVKLVETGEWPLGRLEFPKARRRSRSPR